MSCYTRLVRALVYRPHPDRSPLWRGTVCTNAASLAVTKVHHLGTIVFTQVTAFSTPSSPEWRWRIVNYAGDVIEESRETFRTIATAVASGTQRLTQLNIPDRSVSRPTGWSTSRFRSRVARGGAAR